MEKAVIKVSLPRELLEKAYREIEINKNEYSNQKVSAVAK